MANCAAKSYYTSIGAGGTQALWTKTYDPNNNWGLITGNYLYMNNTYVQRNCMGNFTITLLSPPSGVKLVKVIITDDGANATTFTSSNGVDIYVPAANNFCSAVNGIATIQLFISNSSSSSPVPNLRFSSLNSDLYAPSFPNNGGTFKYYDLNFNQYLPVGSCAAGSTTCCVEGGTFVISGPGTVSHGQSATYTLSWNSPISSPATEKPYLPNANGAIRSQSNGTSAYSSLQPNASTYGDSASFVTACGVSNPSNIITITPTFYNNSTVNGVVTLSLTNNATHAVSNMNITVLKNTAITVTKSLNQLNGCTITNVEYRKNNGAWSAFGTSINIFASDIMEYRATFSGQHSYSACVAEISTSSTSKSTSFTGTNVTQTDPIVYSGNYVVNFMVALES